MFGDLISRVSILDDDLVRNIKGIRDTQALFDDLGDGEDDFALATAAESRDKPPSFAPLITRPFDYGTVISYPFTEFHGQQTRFSDGLSFGVWYGARDLETTVFETVHHFRRFLRDAFAGEEREIVGERRVFKVRCRAILIDLLGQEDRWPALVDRHSYAFTQQLGRYLHDQKQNGLRVRSARCTGSNAAIFAPEVLSNPRDLCYLTYRYRPGTDQPVVVEREAGMVLMEIDGRQLE